MPEGEPPRRDERITLIEGPPPIFEAVHDAWAQSANESDIQSLVALARLRTFNGPALVQRCYHAWEQMQQINFVYRDDFGKPKWAPIVSARNVETPEGNIILLWVRFTQEDSEYTDLMNRY